MEFWHQYRNYLVKNNGNFTHSFRTNMPVRRVSILSKICLSNYIIIQAPNHRPIKWFLKFLFQGPSPWLLSAILDEITFSSKRWQGRGDPNEYSFAKTSFVLWIQNSDRLSLHCSVFFLNCECMDFLVYA